jgi:site-specific recombinase XerD
MIAKRKKLPVTLNKQEVKSLLDVPNKRYKNGLRNRAILSLMINTGLRVSEVSGLKDQDINIKEGKLRVINGKGSKDRDVTIGNKQALEFLKEYNKARPRSNYFFTSLEKDNAGKQLAVRYLQNMVKGYSLRAKIEKNVSPHTLRHTFATEFYRETKDIETLRKILGHSDISTTQIYVTLANIDVEKAMNSFSGFSI